MEINEFPVAALSDRQDLYDAPLEKAVADS
jgi:hypothetical protein